jgi:hypothetical protein
MEGVSQGKLGGFKTLWSLFKIIKIMMMMTLWYIYIYIDIDMCVYSLDKVDIKVRSE